MLGLDDLALLMACAEVGLVLVAFDRATPPWHAEQVLRRGSSHHSVPRHGSAHDYGFQARLEARGKRGSPPSTRRHEPA